MYTRDLADMWLHAMNTYPDVNPAEYLTDEQRQRVQEYWDAIEEGKDPLEDGDKWVISSGMGPRTPPAPGASSYHNGLDLILANGGDETGEPITSVWYGEVVKKIDNAYGWGNYVVVKLDKNRYGPNMYVLMQHMDDFSDIKEGVLIAPGTLLGSVGNTGTGSGPHLHIEVWEGWNNPVNPDGHPLLRMFEWE